MARRVPTVLSVYTHAEVAIAHVEDVAPLRLRAPAAQRAVRSARLKAVQVAVHRAKQQVELAVAREVVGQHLCHSK